MPSILGMHLVHVKCVMLTLAISFFSSSFSVLTSIANLKVVPYPDWPDLGTIGKVWMYSFQKTWHFENQQVGSKVMESGNELKCLAWFSRYLNRFNFDFDPWAVIGNGIQ